MTLSTSLDLIRKLGPCATGYRFALKSLPGDNTVTAVAAREAGCSFEDMSWYLSSIAGSDPEIAKRLRLWMADCAAHVLPRFEAVFADDPRPRAAIAAARLFATGQADSEAMVSAAAGASLASDTAWDTSKAAAQAASAAMVSCETRASWVITKCCVLAASDGPAELAWQYDRLIAWFTGDGPEPLALEGVLA